MPYASYENYRGKTMVADLLDLDEISAGGNQENLRSRHIRQTHNSPLSNQGRPSTVFRQPPPQQAMIQQQVVAEQQGVQEDYEAPQISAALVATRIFPNTSEYIQALDDSDHPLHAIAKSVLQNGGVNSTDKTIYIIIIIVLLIAVGCLLWKCLSKA